MTKRPNRRVRHWLLTLTISCLVSLPMMQPLSVMGQNDVARPLTGTLKVRIPSGIVGGNYWLYVNGTIQSAPPHSALRGSLEGLIPLAQDRRLVLADKGGLVAQFDDGRITYVQPGMRDRIFQHAEDIRLSKGTYVVELLVVGSSSIEQFPFSQVKHDVDVDSGKMVTLDFGVPSGGHFVGWSYGGARAQRGAPTSSPQNWLEFWQQQLQDRLSDYDNNPIARLMTDLALDLRQAPPARPNVLVDLPTEVGGPRQLDGAQIGMIIDKLQRYRVLLGDSDLTFGRNLPQSYSTYFAQLKLQIDSHNKRIDDLREIVQALAHAK